MLTVAGAGIFSVKDQIVTILDFAICIFSVSTLQLCCSKTNGHRRWNIVVSVLPIKLYRHENLLFFIFIF